MNEEGQQILDAIRHERGKTMRMHEILAENDPSFLGGYNAIYNAAQSDRQDLPTYVRELIVMVLDIAVGAAPAAVRGHARRARQAGATQSQVVGAVELAALVMAGKAIGALPVIFDPEPA